LPESIDLWQNHIYSAVQFETGEIFSYGICLFNKFCGFDRVIITKSLSKKSIDNISEEIYKYNNKNNKKFYDALTNLEKNYSSLFQQQIFQV